MAKAGLYDFSDRTIADGVDDVMRCAIGHDIGVRSGCAACQKHYLFEATIALLRTAKTCRGKLLNLGVNLTDEALREII